MTSSDLPEQIAREVNPAGWDKVFEAAWGVETTDHYVELPDGTRIQIDDEPAPAGSPQSSK